MKGGKLRYVMLLYGMLLTYSSNVFAVNLYLQPAVPLWGDTASDCLVVYDGVQKAMTYHMQDLTDEIVIMDYRDYAEGLDGIIDDGDNEVWNGNSIGKKVVIGVETNNLGPSQDVTTFYEEGETYMEGELTKVKNFFQNDSAFNGFAIHDYNNYYSWSSSNPITSSVNRGMWVWNTSSILGNSTEEVKLLNFCSNKDIDIPYMWCWETDAKRFDWNAFITSVHNANRKVYILAGDVSDIYNHQKLLNIKHDVEMFSPAADGMSLDIEYYTLSTWPAERESIMVHYLNLLKKMEENYTTNVNFTSTGWSIDPAGRITVDDVPTPAIGASYTIDANLYAQMTSKIYNTDVSHEKGICIRYKKDGTTSNNTLSMRLYDGKNNSITKDLGNTNQTLWRQVVIPVSSYPANFDESYLQKVNFWIHNAVNGNSGRVIIDDIKVGPVIDIESTGWTVDPAGSITTSEENGDLGVTYNIGAAGYAQIYKDVSYDISSGKGFKIRYQKSGITSSNDLILKLEDGDGTIYQKTLGNTNQVGWREIIIPFAALGNAFDLNYVKRVNFVVSNAISGNSGKVIISDLTILPEIDLGSTGWTVDPAGSVETWEDQSEDRAMYFGYKIDNNLYAQIYKDANFDISEGEGLFFRYKKEGDYANSSNNLILKLTDGDGTAYQTTLGLTTETNWVPVTIPLSALGTAFDLTYLKRIQFIINNAIAGNKGRLIISDIEVVKPVSVNLDSTGWSIDPAGTITLSDEAGGDIGLSYTIDANGYAQITKTFKIDTTGRMGFKIRYKKEGITSNNTLSIRWYDDANTEYTKILGGTNQIDWKEIIVPFADFPVNFHLDYVKKINFLISNAASGDSGKVIISDIGLTNLIDLTTTGWSNDPAGTITLTDETDGNIGLTYTIDSNRYAQVTNQNYNVDISRGTKLRIKYIRGGTTSNNDLTIRLYDDGNREYSKLMGTTNQPNWTTVDMPFTDFPAGFNFNYLKKINFLINNAVSDNNGKVIVTDIEVLK